MKPTLLLIISFVLLAACSPQRRLARLVEHHPELKTADTLCITDTVTLPGVTADTAVPVSVISDPVIVERERLQIIIRKVRDTLYIRGKCKPDTVIIRRQIPVERIHIIRPDNRSALIRRIPWIVVGIVAVCAAVIVLWLRRGN